MKRVNLTVTLVVEVEHDGALIDNGSVRLFDLGDVEPPTTALEHHSDAAAGEFLDQLVRRLDMLGYAPVRISTDVALSPVADPF